MKRSDSPSVISAQSRGSANSIIDKIAPTSYSKDLLGLISIVVFVLLGSLLVSYLPPEIAKWGG